MSRCFPYPPPGYTLSKASNDALIESIKLQNEREKARAEKKERKKAKKEKKEKAEKNKGKEEMPRKKDGNISHEVYGIFQKVGKEEMELLERSGITEELGLPGNSQDPSNSSDSTQNSNKKNGNKRKRHESPVNGGNTGNTGGNILRFRLPSQKQVDSKTSSEVEVQRTSGRIDLYKNDNAGTIRAQLKKLPSVSIPTNSTTVQLLPGESSRVQLNKLPSVSMPTNSSAVHSLPGESRRVRSNKIPSVFTPTNPTAVQSLPGESCRVQLDKRPSISMPTNSTTVHSLPGESSRVQLNKLSSVSAPTNNDNAGPSRVQLNKLPCVSVPPNSANSAAVQLLPGELSKAPSQSAFQHSSEPREKHHDDHVSKKSKKQNKAAKKYAKMIERIPLMPANETMDCDEDWLCCRKNPQEPEVKVQTHNQMSCASSCLLWPRAQYLHEADLFALPYSIPF